MSPDEFPGGPVDLFDDDDPNASSALPYADITDPQSLNKYSYVYNNPLRYIDPNGHDALSFMTGLANSLYSNATLGAAPRIENGDSDLRSGQALGDAFSTVLGGVETLVGDGVELGGIALDATGIGALAGVPANVVGAGIMAHGSGMAVNGTGNLIQDSKQMAGNEPSQLARGKEAHKAEPVRPGEKAEVPTGEGGRMDRYDPDKGHIREIKPNNERGVKAGQAQLERYKAQMERKTKKPHTTELTTY
jgi:Restriction endonuclease fold toxin 9